MDKDKIQESYDRKKKPSIKTLLTDLNWKIDEVVFNEFTGKYDVKATHVQGREVEISRSKQYVDNLLDELEGLNKDNDEQ